MEKYLASVDMDSTFIRNDQSISDYSKEYIKQFVEKGNHFVINTGRPHQGAVHFLKRLDIHEPMIVNNGTAIIWYDNDYNDVEKYVTFHIKLDTFMSFFSKVESFLKNILVTCVFDAYTMNKSTLPFWVVHERNNVKFHEGNINEILNNDPVKVEIYVNAQYREEFEKIANSEEYKNEFEYLYWGVYDNIAVYEFSKKGVNKGYAMQYLCDHYGIKKENTFSFGDELNDVSMLLAANYGVAMINSREKVKLLTKYVSTYDNNNDGVVMFIKELTKE